MTEPQPDRRTAHWTRQPRPEPCWQRDCTNPAAATQNERFSGTYCADCLEIVKADSARMTEELER